MSLEEKTKDAQILVGKTIKSAYVKGHSKDCDGENVLVLETEDNKVFEVEGGYGGYTGKSCDEYIELIHIREIKN